MEEQFAAGRKKAMALLNHNDRTEWELRDRLGRAGFSEEVIDDALAYVERYHYIDDRRYAERFAEIYHESRSIRRIRQDLQNRHVPEEYIELALQNINYDDSGALKREAKKILKGSEEFASLSDKEKEKLAAKLYRRGFRTDGILKLFSQ